MERSTLVPTGMGEQSLTPGEQRILALMEQGQQRLEQRLDRMDQRLQSLEAGQKGTDKHLHSLEAGQKLMDQRLDSMDQQLTELRLKLEQEAAASKMRDKELTADVQRLRDEDRERTVWFLGEMKQTQQATLKAMYQELSSVRTLLSERLDQHDMHLRELGEALQGLQQEMRKLTAAVEGLRQ
jgi:chromosome segregation ATPase